MIGSTGSWRDQAGLSRCLHRRAGVARVLLTARARVRSKTSSMASNNGDITNDDKVLSAASCTTDAIVPVLKAVIRPVWHRARPRRNRAFVPAIQEP